MSILVTGGLGHVGSWVSYLLAKEGKEVIIADKMVSQFENLGFDYLEEVMDKIKLVYLDVSSFQSVSEVMNKYKNDIEGIIHTVALDPGVPSYDGITVNTFGTLNMIEAARIYNINKFIFTSTGAVYGRARGPIKEEFPYQPSDIYGASKASSEMIIEQFGYKYDIDVRCARLFFVYGPGKLPSRMNGLHKGLFSPLAGIRDLHFEKGLDTYADFTFIEDAARGIVKLFEKEKVQHFAYNITSGLAVGVPHIMKVVEEVIEVNPNITFGAGSWLERGAPLDISRAKEELNFTPSYLDIKKGVMKYYEWTQKILKKE